MRVLFLLCPWSQTRTGVCVCVTLGIIGILLDLLSLLSHFLVLPQLGGNEHFGRHCPTKTLPSCCDIPEGRLGNVPAFSFSILNGERLSQEPHDTVLFRASVHFLQMCTSRRHPLRLARRLRP